MIQPFFLSPLDRGLRVYQDFLLRGTLACAFDVLKRQMVYRSDARSEPVGLRTNVAAEHGPDRMSGAPDAYMTPLEEIENLRNELLRHERLYYVESKPEISDYDFDQLMRRLMILEAEHPELQSDISPSVRVGGAPTDNFVRVIHDPPMLSIENAYSYEELDEWDARVRKNLGREEIEYEAELKIDGVSIDLLYEGGRLTRAATRGDGVRGDDVTVNVRTVRSLPLIVPQEFDPLEVRGEIYIDKKQFVRLNEQREEAGEELFANPRNAAAGAVRYKDSKQTAKRGLKAFAYQILRAGEHRLDSQSEVYEVLERLGFATNPGRAVCRSLEEVRVFIEEWQDKRAGLDFEIDGIVVKVNRREYQEELGATSKAPRWAIAFKYPPEAARTVIRSITFQVGRTGTITPVANFDPVIIGGSTVRRSTLHNFEEVARKDIRVGDTVNVEKGGDVIPKVVSVVMELRPEGSAALDVPLQCPACGERLEQGEEEVAVRCVNIACPAIRRESILHFTSRKAMNIEGIGEKVIDTFIAAGLLEDFSSIYALTLEQLTSQQRWGEKSASNLLEEIERSRTNELERLIFGIGIRFVGERVAKLLAAEFHSIENLLNADLAALTAVPEIGPRVAEAIISWAADPSNRARLERMHELGVSPTFTSRVSGDSLQNMTVVVTGTLRRHTRDEIHKLIEREGGKASGSVSSKTSLLVAGENAGSKLEKAETLKVKIVTEDEFLAMVAGLSE